MARFPFSRKRAPEERHAPSQPWDWEKDTWLTPLPVPEAREGGQSTWDAWHEAARELDQAFAPTMPSEPAPLAQPREAVQPPLSAEALMVEARRNNRVCPLPLPWSELYGLLEGSRYVDLPPPPVEQGIWRQLSDLQKRLRFREYVEWAERHRRLAEMQRFMHGLAEADWLHMGER